MVVAMSVWRLSMYYYVAAEGGFQNSTVCVYISFFTSLRSNDADQLLY